MNPDSFYGDDRSDSDFNGLIRSERKDGGRHNRNAPPPAPQEISSGGKAERPSTTEDNVVLWVIGGIAILTLLAWKKG